MNPHLKFLIDRENTRIDALRAQIAKRERNIKMLLELAQDDGEDPGPLPAEQTPKSAVAVANTSVDDSPVGAETTAPPEVETHRFPKKISANSLKLLWYFGQGPKTLDEAVAFSEEEKLGMDRRNISSFANVYRSKFGLVESPAVGLYRLTGRGREFVQERYKPTEVLAKGPSEDHEESSIEGLV